MRFATVACVVAIALPSTASAQERKGFWGSLGLGAGSIAVSAETAASRPFQEGRDGGGVGELNLGWAVNPQLLAGLELKVMAAKLAGGNGELVISNVSGTLTYYPRPSSNFFVKGGAGGSFLDVTFEALDADISIDAGKGFGFTVGAGYDVSLGRGFSLTPAVAFWHGQPGDFRLAGQTLLKDWRHNVIDVTLSIKFN
jgi:hypothetical protein